MAARHGDRDVEVNESLTKKEVTVLGMLEDAKRRWAAARPHLAQAHLNEEFVAGRQTLEVSSGDRGVLPTKWPEHVPRITRNLLGNLALTWSARVLKDRRDTKAWPNEAGVDIGVVDVANAVLKHYKTKHRRDEMLARAAQLVQAHGSVAFKIAWDPTEGERPKPKPVIDPASGQPMLDEMGAPVLQYSAEALGDVVVDLVSIFDFVTDGSEDVAQSRWVLFRRMIDVDDAKARLVQAKYDEDPPTEQAHPDSFRADSLEPMVECYELWHRRTALLPGGLYSMIVGGCVIDARPFPYEHGELPLAVWKCKERRGSAYGDTHVTDAVPQQRALNEALSSVARLVRLAGDVKGTGSSEIIDKWDDGQGFIPVNDPKVRENFGFITPPPISRDLYEAIDRYTAAVAEAFGVNEVVASGGDVQQTKSARQLAYISELDGQKLALTRLSLDEALLRTDRQVLRLVQENVTDERVIQIAGEQNEPLVAVFRGAEIGGVDVILEPAPGAERFRAAGAASAEEAAAAGFMDPARAGELRDTGLAETLAEAASRRRVHQQIAEASSGGQPMADPAVDPGLAIAEIELALQAGGGGGPPELLALLEEYRQLADQAQAEATGGAPGGKVDTTSLQPTPSIEETR